VLKLTRPPGLLLASLALALVLTGLFYVHEDLPAAIRAPSSLLLTPVAVASGLSHLLGGIDVYESPLAVFLANLAGSMVPLAVLGRLLLRRRRAG
jgi:hypothetical protein